MKGKAENAKILGATLSAGVVTKQVLFFEQALLLTPLSGKEVGFYVFSDDMPQQHWQCLLLCLCKGRPKLL